MIAENTEKVGQYITKTGIPIQNLWYMLLYVWNVSRMKNRWHSEVEKAPTIDALFANILAMQIQQRLRIGLGRAYRQKSDEVYGIRCRIDFNETLKRMSFSHGRTFCQHQVFHGNVPKNQIIRSTLTRLIQKGDFGIDSILAQNLRKKFRKLVQEMEGIDCIELKTADIRREQLKQQDADYGLMLSLCYLIILRQMPREDRGDYFLHKLDRDTLILHDIFEKFVAAFYKRHLKNWQVWSQQSIKWPTPDNIKYLPIMKPDLTMQHRQSKRLIILDTKFTKNSIVSGQWGKDTFNSSHLYQLYAYLKSQEHRSEYHKSAAGILLYPAVKQKLQEKAEIQGHEIHWMTVDLTEPWEDIENNLMSFPTYTK